MITPEILERLNTIQGGDHFILSVYLGVDPVHHPRGEYFVHFRNLLRAELEQNPEAQKALGSDIQRVESLLKGGRKQFKQSIVVFASTPLNLWEVFHLALPIPDVVVVDRTPYLKPLVSLVRSAPSDLVVLVDREHGRLFRITQGEIQEYIEVVTEDVPGRHRKGGWYGRDENRFRRHIEDHVRLHLKDVLKQLEQQLREREIRWIFLGGAEEAVTQFQKLLPSPVSQKVVATFPDDLLHATRDTILKRIQGLIQEAERRYTEGLVEDLITRAQKNGTAAVGLEDVLAMLREGRVHLLLYRPDLRAAGFRCTTCGFLTPQELDSCPYCGGSLERVEHLMDLAIQRALEQGAQAVAVRDNPAFDQTGGMGALLRY